MTEKLRAAALSLLGKSHIDFPVESPSPDVMTQIECTYSGWGLDSFREKLRLIQFSIQETDMLLYALFTDLKQQLAQSEAKFSSSLSYIESFQVPDNESSSDELYLRFYLKEIALNNGAVLETNNPMGLINDVELILSRLRMPTTYNIASTANGTGLMTAMKNAGFTIVCRNDIGTIRQSAHLHSQESVHHSHHEFQRRPFIPRSEPFLDALTQQDTLSATDAFHIMLNRSYILRYLADIRPSDLTPTQKLLLAHLPPVPNEDTTAPMKPFVRNLKSFADGWLLHATDGMVKKLLRHAYQQQRIPMNLLASELVFPKESLRLSWSMLQLISQAQQELPQTELKHPGDKLFMFHVIEPNGWDDSKMVSINQLRHQPPPNLNLDTLEQKSILLHEISQRCNPLNIKHSDFNYNNSLHMLIACNTPENARRDPPMLGKSFKLPWSPPYHEFTPTRWRVDEQQGVIVITYTEEGGHPLRDISLMYTPASGLYQFRFPKAYERLRLSTPKTTPEESLADFHLKMLTRF